MPQKIEVESISLVRVFGKTTYQLALQISQNEISFIQITVYQYLRIKREFRNFIDKTEVIKIADGGEIVKTYFIRDIEPILF
jgi:hypothetical protein